MIKTAIILTAGLGSRLKPLTLEMPKCLTELNGKTLLEHTLKILEKNEIEETVIVIGYLGEIIKRKIGGTFGHMKITYLHNNIYDQTNSMYSVWLARKYLQKGALLIEGDTVFDDLLIKKLLNSDNKKSYWALDQFTPKFNGSMSIADPQNRITEIKIIRGRLREYKKNYYKSTGVLKITPKYGNKFADWLKKEVQKKNTNIYYDLVIGKHLSEFPLYVCDITGQVKWAEIDNFDDLNIAEELFRPTKYIIIIIDGAADNPISSLKNKTPLETAKMPYLQYLTRNGQTGVMKTMYEGLEIGSIVANMGILGYNPLRYYPNGRASFEALAQDILLKENDIAFRCNLISVKNGINVDFTASNIPSEQGEKIIKNLKLPFANLEIYPGQSYRNLLILRNADFNASEIIAPEPHGNVGNSIESLMLKGTTPKSKKVVAKLNNFILDSLVQIKKLNKKHKTAADMIAIWSPSSTPRLSSFHKKFDIDGAVIGGMDFMKGIAMAANMGNIKPKGATGYSDTNLEGKLKTTQNNLMYNDLVFLHINAPDEESHNRNVKAKVNVLEKIDRVVIGPLIKFLDDNFSNKYRVAVMPDHYTYLHNGKHSDRPVPYCLYGEGIKKDDINRFSEREIEKNCKTIIKSYEFMDFFLRG